MIQLYVLGVLDLFKEVLCIFVGQREAKLKAVRVLKYYNSLGVPCSFSKTVFYFYQNFKNTYFIKEKDFQSNIYSFVCNQNKNFSFDIVLFAVEF